LWLDGSVLLILIRNACCQPDPGLAARQRGYAPAAAFTEPDHLMLPAAVRNEAAPAGRGDGDGRASVPPGWEKRAARLPRRPLPGASRKPESSVAGGGGTA
jgi:hypothetical protein